MIPDQISFSISSFTKVGLKEADIVKLMTRHDEKYICTVAELPAILKKAATLFRILDIDGTRIQNYETTYLDTADHRMYLDHHNGKLNRYKIRFREYLGSHQFFLEIKKKDNHGDTEKTRIQITQDFTYKHGANRAFILENSPFDPRLLEPVLTSSFSRITLIGAGIGERVTLDLHPSWRHGSLQASLPGVVIIEVKSARGNSAEGFGHLLREQRVMTRRISKYCTGTCLLYPEIRQNRFKLKLLHLKKVNNSSEIIEYDHASV
jgi:hypothetical protein